MGANLRLGTGGDARAGSAAAPHQLGGMKAAADRFGATGAAGADAATGSRTSISSKAASLRAYLRTQMPEADYELAYNLVRKSGNQGAEAGEALQGSVAQVIGADKAKELFTLFQLLCFLED